MTISQEKLVKTYQTLYNLIFEVCRKRNVRIVISTSKLADAITHHCRDMEKLDEHQGPQISANKRIAGLVFWIRRIKPISFACTVTCKDEIQDINEQVSLWIAHNLLIRYCQDKNAPEIIKNLNIANKSGEFSQYLSAHWKIHNHFNYSSLIYSLRYRNFSPHHLAIIFDSITTGFVLKNTHVLQGVA